MFTCTTIAFNCAPRVFLLSIWVSIFTRSVCFNWVFPKSFHWICWTQWQKIFVIKVKGLEHAASCVRDQNATKRQQDLWKTGSLNWLKFKFSQWFIRFPELAELIEFQFHLGKTPVGREISMLMWTDGILKDTYMYNAKMLCIIIAHKIPARKGH